MAGKKKKEEILDDNGLPIDQEEAKKKSSENPYIVINPLDEARAPLTSEQRRKRALVMKRYQSRIEAARERSRHRRASNEKLLVRARHHALGIIRQKLAVGKPYAEMTVAEKISVDKRLLKIPAFIIDRIARKLLPTIRQAENTRLATMNHMNESAKFPYTIYDLHEDLKGFLEAEDLDDPFEREEGTSSLTKIYKNATPGQSINEEFTKRFGK